MNRKSNILFLILALFMGIIIVSHYITSYVDDYYFYKTAVKTEAIITNISIKYDSDTHESYHTVLVKYKFNGTEYNNKLVYYDSFMTEGNKITVFVNPNSPNQIKYKHGNGISIFSFLIGISIVISTITYIFLKIRKTFEKIGFKDKISSSKKVYAEIIEITINTSIVVNHKSPYKIVCKWTDPKTNLIHFFTTDDIWFDPQYVIQKKGIKKLVVYINTKNHSSYFIPLDEIT